MTYLWKIWPKRRQKYNFIQNLLQPLCQILISSSTQTNFEFAKLDKLSQKKITYENQSFELIYKCIYSWNLHWNFLSKKEQSILKTIDNNFNWKTKASLNVVNSDMFHIVNEGNTKIQSTILNCLPKIENIFSNIDIWKYWNQIFSSTETKNIILETRSSSQQKEIQKLKDIVKNSSSSQQEEIQKLKDENEKLRYIIDNFEKDIVKNIIFETEKELKEEK